MYYNRNPRYPRNHGKYWSGSERRAVRRMRHDGAFLHEIAREFGRTTQGIRDCLAFTSPYRKFR